MVVGYEVEIAQGQKVIARGLRGSRDTLWLLMIHAGFLQNLDWRKQEEAQHGVKVELQNCKRLKAMDTG